MSWLCKFNFGYFTACFSKSGDSGDGQDPCIGICWIDWKGQDFSFSCRCNPYICSPSRRTMINLIHKLGLKVLQQTTTELIYLWLFFLFWSPLLFCLVFCFVLFLYFFLSHQVDIKFPCNVYAIFVFIFINVSFFFSFFYSLFWNKVSRNRKIKISKPLLGQKRKDPFRKKMNKNYCNASVWKYLFS